MEYKKIEKLSRKKFRRKVGIKVDTFKKMVTILKKKELEKKIKGGKPHSLLMEDYNGLKKSDNKIDSFVSQIA